MRGQLTQEQRQHQIITRLQNENNKLRERVKILETENIFLKSQLENVMVQLENLKEIVFGKKKSKNNDDKDKGNDIKGNNNNSSGKPRNNKSYRRAAPDENEITNIETHKITNCPHCHTRLTKKKIIERYIEDIQLAINETIGEKIKEITKQIIEQGYCPKCRRWYSAIPLNGQVVTIGSNVKQFVAYAINALRMSYEQTRNILKDLYKFEIADGEIANILEEISKKLHLEYERLKERILEAKSTHLDETSWQTQSENNYVWNLSSGETEEAVFLIGRSRGKGNGEELLKGYKGVRITDCYAAYKNMDGEHQVCWAHIVRKARDLAKSEVLEKEKKEFAREIYFELQFTRPVLRNLVSTYEHCCGHYHWDCGSG